MSDLDNTAPRSHSDRETSNPRKPWVAPAVTELPKLQNLTLQTGAPVGGNQSTFP